MFTIHVDIQILVIMQVKLNSLQLSRPFLILIDDNHEGFSYLQIWNLKNLFFNVEFNFDVDIDVDIFQVWFWPLSDETKKFHRDRYRDFFSRPRPFSRPNIFETDTETFFWDQMFSRPIPGLFFETKCFFETDTETFLRPNVFETDTETFAKIKK